MGSPQRWGMLPRALGAGAALSHLLRGKWLLRPPHPDGSPCKRPGTSSAARWAAATPCWLVRSPKWPKVSSWAPCSCSGDLQSCRRSWGECSTGVWLWESLRRPSWCPGWGGCLESKFMLQILVFGEKFQGVWQSAAFLWLLMDLFGWTT